VNAYELLKPDLSPSGVWACGKCNKVYASDASKVFADRCCDFRCADCGSPCNQHYTRCDACVERLRAKKKAIEQWPGQACPIKANCNWSSALWDHCPQCGVLPSQLPKPQS